MDNLEDLNVNSYYSNDLLPVLNISATDFNRVDEIPKEIADIYFDLLDGYPLVNENSDKEKDIKSKVILNEHPQLEEITNNEPRIPTDPVEKQLNEILLKESNMDINEDFNAETLIESPNIDIDEEFNTLTLIELPKIDINKDSNAETLIESPKINSVEEINTKILFEAPKTNKEEKKIEKCNSSRKRKHDNDNPSQSSENDIKIVEKEEKKENYKPSRKRKHDNNNSSQSPSKDRKEVIARKIKTRKPQSPSRSQSPSRRHRCQTPPRSSREQTPFLTESQRARSQTNNNFKQEIDVKNPEFMPGVSGVKPVITQPKLNQLQRMCQDMCGSKRVGFPGLHPISMDIYNMKLLEKRQYKVSWKANGRRYMMLIDGQNDIYFIDRDNCVFQVENVQFPKKNFLNQHVQQTLVDGEMVIDKIEGKTIPNYLIYDVIVFDGQDMKNCDLDNRLRCIQEELIAPRRIAKEKGLIDKSIEPFGVKNKDFWDVDISEKLLGDKFLKQLSHEVDGLVFQPVNLPYFAGRSKDVLKWKPLNMNTIDFQLYFRRGDKYGNLFVTRSNTPFGRIRITDELEYLYKRIIECKYENDEWRFVRERIDKSYPNGFEAAYSVWRSIVKPVTKKMLLEFIEQRKWRAEAQRKSPPRYNYSYYRNPKRARY